IKKITSQYISWQYCSVFHYSLYSKIVDIASVLVLIVMELLHPGYIQVQLVDTLLPQVTIPLQVGFFQNPVDNLLSLLVTEQKHLVAAQLHWVSLLM
ncbi:MAG: hypothetical protein KJ615_01875, partial [Bacteroidetes bacterium]|nr:hypothetical protein [Bacteroidota bacterium]